MLAIDYQHNNKPLDMPYTFTYDILGHKLSFDE